MYDTSDIRKGLKVLMDGNPFTVIEFQFVKPGKCAACGTANDADARFCKNCGAKL